MSKTAPLKISVSKSILQWAIQRSGKSIDELAKRQSMKKLKEWVIGESEPTLKQLETFATATFTPFGYLFLSSPPDEQIPIPYFRTGADLHVTGPSINLIDTIQIIEQRQDWMREYLIADRAEPLEFVGSVKHTDSPRATARKIKDKLDIDSEWAAKQSTWSDALSELKSRIEKAGIFLSVSGIVGLHTHRPLDPKEFRGFVLVDKYAPFIFVNNKDFKAAQMFTLAHELAHIWIGRSAAFDLHHLEPANNAVEKACNQIAAEFLVPGKTLSEQWAQFNKERDPFHAGARYFKVSEIVVARRALDIKTIDLNEFLKFYKKQREKAKHASEQGSGDDFYNTAPIRVGKTFMKNVINAVMENKLLYREAYNLTGLTRRSFDGMQERIASEEQSA